MPRPLRTTLHPSVVEVVSAMVSAGAPRKRASARTDLVATGEHRLEVRLTGATLLEVAGERGPHRLHGPARERPVRARVEIGEPVEDGETCADGV